MLNGEFLAIHNYEMRKSFINLLYQVANVPLEFEDVHSKNLMYDTVQNLWILIDVDTYESKYRYISQQADLLAEFVRHLTSSFIDEQGANYERCCILINKLTEVVLDYDEYTKEIDKEFIYFCQDNLFKPVGRKSRIC